MKLKGEKTSESKKLDQLLPSETLRKRAPSRRVTTKAEQEKNKELIKKEERLVAGGE